MARGLGYTTYAALRVALKTGPVSIDRIYLESALTFAEQIELDTHPDDVREALCALARL
ncbi:hypothetical protein [Limimaricola sp. AA108-03]|uniref:hypothetical protein n=1 Tax=Limimaricola sp. AA108-03 TaxID=3425945 RepID=UPI003D76CC43